MVVIRLAFRSLVRVARAAGAGSRTSCALGICRVAARDRPDTPRSQDSHVRAKWERSRHRSVTNWERSHGPVDKPKPQRLSYGSAPVRLWPPPQTERLIWHSDWSEAILQAPDCLSQPKFIHRNTPREA